MTGKTVDPDQLSRIVMLAYGQMDHGGPYWCYVAVRPSRFDEFQATLATKKYNIQHFVQDGYGEVIVSGEGVTPPGEVTKQVAKMFDIPIKQLFTQTDQKSIILNKIKAFSNDQPNGS